MNKEEKKITVIAEIDSNKRLKEFINNMKAETERFSCELILTGRISKKNAAKIDEMCSDSFSIKLIEDSGNAAADLNKALDMSAGSIINITSVTCEYPKGSVKAAVELLDSGDGIKAVSLTPYYVTVKGGETRIRQFKVRNQQYPICIDFASDTEDSWGRYLFSFFVKREVIEDIRFCEDLEYEYCRAFLSALYAVQPVYYLLEQKVILHEYPDVDMYNYHPMYNFDWYTDELKTLAQVLLDISDENRINQRILMDFISMQFSANAGDRSKSILIGEDLDRYLDSIGEILKNIDDDIISVLHSGQHKRIPYPMYSLFLQKKYGEEIPINPEIAETDYEFGDGYKGPLYKFVTDKGVIIAVSDKFYVGVRAINLYGRELVFDAEMNNFYFDSIKSFDISIVSSDGKAYDIRPTEVYSLKKMFGITMFKRMTFQFRIPLTDGKETRYHISFKYKGIEIVPRISFNKPQARIKNNQAHNFWNVADNTFKYCGESREIILTKRSALRTIGNEIRYWPDIFEHTKDKKRAASFVGLRLLYYLTKPYYGRKNIWLTFDQLFKGGDNGEYFFRYVNDLGNKHQRLYYAVNEDTPEYRELSKKYKTVLKFSSLKHKLTSLHTNIVFTTRADATLYAGFAKTTEIFFRDLFNFDVVCLQHGLSIQQIAQYQNRVFDNLKYYFCVSKYEIANLSKPIYGFEDKSMLVLTGAPRYDGLVGTPKKQIIISPTWRRNVTSGTNKKGSNHEYSSNFKSTHYYQIYNGLINDSRLLECAKETGYKLIYLIHPILSPQIDDFDKNDYVTILPGTEVNYEKILVDSALMLTDHSGIMYDFAYQRKPLIYYHPEELPPQYSEGGLNYETMGFGPVCRTRDEVVDALCRAMKNDCRLEDKYKDRIEDFFEFDDQRNCERVYNAALEFEKRQSR